MSDFAWWALFIILCFLLVSITLRLFFRIINDVCCDSLATDSTSNENLSRYKINSNTIYQDLEYKDETDIHLTATIPPQSDTVIDLTQNSKDFEAIEIEENIEEEKEDDSKEKEQQQQPEELHYTHEELEALNQLQAIENNVKICAKQIPFCLGGKQHLQYFEINQNFIMNQIALGSIDCKENENLQKRRQSLSVYIQDCKNDLKLKVEEFV